MSDLRELHLIDDIGTVDCDGGTWLAAASTEDERVLARARGPVLDVGCGPARHVRALQALGVDVLGIDVTPSVLTAAWQQGAPVLVASIFQPLPRMRQWRTALLLDGNSGIGGDPVHLLRRLRQVLRPRGTVLADLLTGPQPKPRQLRLRHGAAVGPPFRWAPLHIDGLDAVASTVGTAIVDVWHSGNRWFCELRFQS